MLKIKECPNCNRTYSDLSLSFCLNDGSVLSAPYISSEFGVQLSLFEDETETVVVSKKEDVKLSVSIKDDAIYFGDDLRVTFCRTLRIPDDGDKYDLPASLGTFPIYKVSDYTDKVPKSWNKHGGVFIPMYQSEALFIEFHAMKSWQPVIAKVATGKVNAITGEEWHQYLFDDEQDYVVVPPQKWLDGYKTSKHTVRQFVAMPLGQGFTVESQIIGEESVGGIQLIAYKPKDDIFFPPPPKPPVRYDIEGQNDALFQKSERMLDMGIGAGGKIKQKVYEDEYGVETWDENHYGRIFVHIVNSQMFKQITGFEPPTKPIDLATYYKYKIPFFMVYDEPLNDVKTPEKLFEIKPIELLKKMKETKANEVEDGDW
jgi:hypothetical protein